VFGLGISEKLSNSNKGNFVGAEGGSLGMRWVKVVNSPFLGRDFKENLGKEIGREYFRSGGWPIFLMIPIGDGKVRTTLRESFQPFGLGCGSIWRA